MSETIIKAASVKVTLETNKNFFSIELTLENETGLNLSEINKAREDAQELAKTAADQHRVKQPVDSKQEIARIERELKGIKDGISEKQDLKSDDRPEVIAEVEKLPLYNPKSKKK